MKLKLDKFKILVQIGFAIMVLVSIAWSDWVDLTGDEPVRRELSPGERPPEPTIEVIAFDSLGEVVEDGDIESIYRFEISVTIPGFFAEEEEVEGEIYTHLSIPTFASNGNNDIGKPSYPLKPILLMIPPSTEPLASLPTINQMILDQIIVFPEQEPITDSVGAPPSFQKDIDAYNSDQFFPESYIIHSASRIRNHRILSVSITPLLFNPLNKELHIAQSLEFEIILEPSDSPETRVEPGLASYSFDKLLIPDMGKRDLQQYNPERYMIIMHDVFQNNTLLREFIDWKTKKGYNVVCTLTSEIPHVNEKPTYLEIQAFLDDLPDYEYPVYLLIIGDTTRVDAAETYIPSGWTKGVPNDLWYSWRIKDANDPENNWAPDLFYGRIPAYHNDELSIMLTKILKMDKDPPETNMYNKVLSTGIIATGATYLETMDAVSEYFNKDAYNIDYNSTYEEIKDWCAWYAPWDVQPDDIWQCTASGSSSLLWKGVPQDLDTIGERVSSKIETGMSLVRNRIKDRINEGISIVSYRGHGGTSCWVNEQPLYEVFNVDHINGWIRNGNNLPLILSIACNTGRYHADDAIHINFARKWLNQNKGGGAYAVVGATTLSYTEANEWLTHGLFGAFCSDQDLPGQNWYTWFNNDDFGWHEEVDWWKDLPIYTWEETYFKNLIPGSATKLGQMLHFGKMYVLRRWGKTNVNYKNIVQVYHLFGDPEAEVILHEPVDISYSVTHPAVIEAGKEAYFNIGLKSGTDIGINLDRNPLRICLYSEDVDNVNVVGSLGYMGQNFILSPQTTGEILVTITGFGIRPFRGKIRVVDEINPCDLYIINTKFDDVYQASAQRYIYAGPNVLIESPADVTFVAGKEIHLTPDFKAKAEIGQLFHAFIDQGLYDPECD